MAAKRPCRQAAQQTKNSIMEAAVQVFAEKGYYGATTSEIARVAGISEASIYRYFTSKKDLLLSVMAPTILKSVFTLLIENDHDSVGALKKFVKHQFDLMKNNTHLMKVLFYESIFHKELGQQVAEEVVLKAEYLLRRMYVQRVNEGQFRPLNPQAAVLALMGMMAFNFFWTQVMEGHRYIKISDEQLIDTFLDIYLHGVTPR